MTRHVVLPSLLLAGLAFGACRPAATNETAPAATPVAASPAPTPIVVPVASVTTGFMGAPAPTETAEAEPVPVAAAQAMSSCGLRATLRELKPADPSGHRFALDLKNEGKQAVKLVVAGDGSSAGWRTPIITWTATQNGKAATPEVFGRCGLTNPLTVQEIFILAPGQSKTMTDWLDPVPFTKGTFELRVHYKNDPALASKEGKGQAAFGDVQKAFAATSACEVTSNALKVTFKP